jgi:hypothetical protein
MQELYDLADKFAKENRVQSIGAPGNNYFELFHEKFAELIVRETMQVVANQLPSNQYLDVAQAVIEHYKEH